MQLSLSSRLGRGNAGFTPLRFSPALWLDASDASTLYDSTVGGSLVAANGTVARWEDKSGNGRHATQSTGTQQPLRKTSIIHGRDVLRFDGAGDELVCSASAIQSRSIFSVQVATSAAPAQQTIYRHADAVLTLTRFETGNLRAYNGGPFDITAATSPTSLLLLSTVFGNAQAVARANGAQIGIDATGSWSTVGNSPIYIGGITGVESFGGDIAELIVYETPLTDDQRSQVELYLNRKWAIY